MGVAKVVLNGSTIIDTTGTTVTSDTMVSPATALNKAGNVVTGSITTNSAFAPAITLKSETGIITGTNSFASAYYMGSVSTSTFSLTTQVAQTFTPASTAQYISSYQWLLGSQTIAGDANLVPENIASGVSIFGVTGTFEGGGGQTRTAYLIQCFSTSTFNTVLTYSGTQYSNLGANTTSFTFVPGTNMTFSGSASAGYVSSATQVVNILKHNGSIVAYRSTSGTFNYTWQCPDNDLHIYFLGNGGFDIYDEAGDFWTAGPYRFDGYANIYGACWLYSNSAITYIGASKFHYTYGLTSINIPNVSIISQSAFVSCSSLKNISGPNIKQIGQRAFYYCNALTDLNFPVCTTVEASAFETCTRLSSINLPLCTYLGAYAFSQCTSLSSISIPNIGDTIRSGTFYSCAFSDISFLPSTVTTIEYGAFQRCKYLTVVSHSNINTIEQGAFANCSALVEVNLPQCTSISASTFQNCSSLLTVNLPMCVAVGNYTFLGCSNLSNINISSCTSISNGAFQTCTNLSSINLPLCTSIGAYAFQDCYSLSNINIPVCTSINSNAFYNCFGLLNINLSACVSLSAYAFYGCSNLTSVILSACTYIGAQAFRGCWNLISVYLSSASVVPTLSTAVFSSTPIGGYSASAGRYGSVFVPASLYNSFITATNWTAISSRIVSV